MFAREGVIIYHESMGHASLNAPWRIEYLRSLSESGACFLCDAAASITDEECRERLVLWTTTHSVVLLNRYPYTNGHLLVAPRAHKADLGELSHEELLDLQTQTVKAIELLKRAISPQGFNLGVNLGRCAGAGVPGHLHQHVVPRWGGDTNFMAIVGDVRIVPQALTQLYSELRRCMQPTPTAP
jgi:ATP adenylyltransferase